MYQCRWGCDGSTEDNEAKKTSESGHIGERIFLSYTTVSNVNQPVSKDQNSLLS